MRAFGIFTASVAARLRLLIELPPRDGIAMSLNRDQLKYEDGLRSSLSGGRTPSGKTFPTGSRSEMREQVIDLDADLDDYGKKLISKYAQTAAFAVCFGHPTTGTSAQRPC